MGFPQNNKYDEDKAVRGNGFLGLILVIGAVIVMGAFILEYYALYLISVVISYVAALILIRILQLERSGGFLLVGMLILSFIISHSIYKRSTDDVEVSDEKIIMATELYRSVKLDGKARAKLEVGELVEIKGINRARTAYKINTIDGKKGWIPVVALPKDMLLPKYTILGSVFNENLTSMGAAKRQEAERKAGLRPVKQITSFPKIMYSNAKAGVRKRSEPSVNSVRIGVYLYGEKIQIIGGTDKPVTIDGVTDYWYKTKAGFDFEGTYYEYSWVFGGFLSEKPPL